MPGAEVGPLVMAAAALAAGVIRGFTGFGGPAFLLAILTIFYAPTAVLGKILVVDLTASVYLFCSTLHHAHWKSAAYLIVPSLVMLPAGHWIQLHMDPLVLRDVIALTIACCAVVMLCGLRYRRGLSPVVLAAFGALSGIVFGATYIALVVVALILLGPYDKSAARALIITWAFIVALGYGVVSIASGATTLGDLWVALPGAAAYLAGAWLGSRWFRESAEGVFRKAALFTLLGLSVVALLS